MASNRLAWLGGAALGAVALVRALTRRPPPAPVYAPPSEPEAEPSGPDPRAEELRTKLAESRAAEAESGDEPASGESDLDARRREVHERARGSIDELGNT